jgi:hypothetical protein
MIEDLLREGIIKHADYSGPFLSDGHRVPKPDKNISVAGKADLYLLAQSNVSTNHACLSLDLRNLNKHLLGKPKINLPSHKDLVNKFKDHHVTCINLCSQYWVISTDYSCQHLSNFWYNHRVYAFTRLPMGYSKAAYIAQTASELAYGQETMEKFLQHKGWSAGDSN